MAKFWASTGRHVAGYVFCSFIMYGYGFLSWGFTDRRKILHGGSVTSQTGLLLFWGIAPGMADLWASREAIWRNILLAEAFVVSFDTSYRLILLLTVVV